jgi:hypothetical protein
MKFKNIVVCIIIFPIAIVWLTLAIVGAIFSTLGIIIEDSATYTQEFLEGFL